MKSIGVRTAMIVGRRPAQSSGRSTDMATASSPHPAQRWSGGRYNLRTRPSLRRTASTSATVAPDFRARQPMHNARSRTSAATTSGSVGMVSLPLRGAAMGGPRGRTALAGVSLWRFPQAGSRTLHPWPLSSPRSGAPVAAPAGDVRPRGNGCCTGTRSTRWRALQVRAASGPEARDDRDRRRVRRPGDPSRPVVSPGLRPGRSR